MARFTKQAIMDAFTALLNERPLDKITVTDLVKTCGINRNTFYYYFHDVYALASAVLEQGLSRICANTEKGAIFSALSDYAAKNRRLVYHIYHADHALLEAQLFRAAYDCISAHVRAEAEGIDCTERDIEQLAVFCAYATTGSILQWLNSGMREPLAAYIEENTSLLSGGIRAVLLYRAGEYAAKEAV